MKLKLIMLRIEELLEHKKAGIDCDDDGSAQVKDFLKDIAYWFPSEFSEAIDEMERDIWLNLK